ncbi:MAG: hypothetical protein E6767_03350 [Dysgonomonas sp.]|nr:hypothetical protein [Dysgonomonas sp.]
MKRYITLTLILYLFSPIMIAQKDKIWIDFSVQNNIPLRAWNSNKNINNYIKTRTIGVAFRANFMVNHKWGLWGEMSFITSDRASDDMKRKEPYLFEYDSGKYYNSLIKYNEGSSNSLSTGFFRNYKYKNLKISPFFGLGIDMVTPQSLEYSAKEKGSNNRYSIFYTNSSYGTESDMEFFAYVTPGVTVAYLIPRTHFRFSLSVGFQQYLNNMSYTRIVRDYYTSENIEKNTYKGQLASSMNINVGIIGYVF